MPKKSAQPKKTVVRGYWCYTGRGERIRHCSCEKYVKPNSSADSIVAHLQQLKDALIDKGVDPSTIRVDGFYFHVRGTRKQTEKEKNALLAARAAEKKRMEKRRADRESKRVAYLKQLIAEYPKVAASAVSALSAKKRK